MKKLLITLFLISPFSFADWGDVYYCQSITFNIVLDDGEILPHKSERFKFKMDKESRTMVFGSSPVLWANQSHPVVSFKQYEDGKLFFETKSFAFGDFKSTFKYDKGKLYGAGFAAASVIGYVADCEKF